MTSQAKEDQTALERIMLMQALPEDAARRFLSAEGALNAGSDAGGSYAGGTPTLSARIETLYRPIDESHGG